MRTLRQPVRNESGMTLPLAMIMIVLLGVMGAGLLTFVMRDLNTVVEENRGQRAFEVADAGIGAAKVQLASGVNTGSYDDKLNPPTVVGEVDIQWSKAKGGLTLQDLDDDGTTPDSVTVTIEYMGDDTKEFRVISEGTYGDPLQHPAKRRIEAIFHGLEAGAGGEGENVGHPLYYTPSSISIDGPDVQMNAISVFAGQDLLIEGVANTANVATNMASFQSEYEGSGGTFLG